MRASWRRRWTAAATQFFGPACTSSREAFLWWKHLKRYFCTLRNAGVHLEMGTVTEKLQLTGIKEFANSNTCCPGVEDQWQGRASSDILTSESKQLNILNLHSHVDVWNGAWLISKRDNTNVHECDQLLNAFKFPPVRDVANAYAQCRAVFSTDLKFSAFLLVDASCLGSGSWANQGRICNLVASLASSWIFTHIVRSETEHILTRFFSSSKAFAIDCGNAATTLKITRKEVSAVYSGTVWFGLF